MIDYTQCSCGGHAVCPDIGASTGKLYEAVEQDVFSMVGTLGELFTEFHLDDLKIDADKKVKAMFLCGDEYRALVELLGGPDDVDYITFKIDGYVEE